MSFHAHILVNNHTQTMASHTHTHLTSEEPSTNAKMVNNISRFITEMYMI